jgi:CRP/FNR family transcriptional regulator
MLTNAIYMRMLDLFPALHGMSTRLTEELVAVASAMTLPADTVLFDDGVPCLVFPLLLAGSMKVVKSAANGREIVLYRKHPGEVCPISTGCLLGQARYPARGVAEGKLQMIGMGAGLFENLLADHAPFRRMVFAEFGVRLTEMMVLVEEIAFSRVDQRLARLLVERGDLDLSHQQIAEELGSVREVVSRLLRQFEQQHMVQLGRERVVVLDRARLMRFMSA